jgi:hypothetical protein
MAGQLGGAIAERDRVDERSIMVSFDGETEDEDRERERRRKAIDEARQTTRRLKDIRRRREDVENLPADEVAKRLIADADRLIENFRRERAAGDDEIVRKRFELGPVVETRAAAADDNSDGWNRWFDGRIERERALIWDVVGEVIATERRNAERKIADLSGEVAKLRDELRQAREAAASARATGETIRRANESQIEVAMGAVSLVQQQVAALIKDVEHCLRFTPPR